LAGIPFDPLAIQETFTHTGAAQQFIACPTAQQAIITLGLGNSPNDLEMLENVDIPIVVPGCRGSHPELADRG
jgi:mannosyl-3-phosphoglycerate phosphatase